MGKFGDGTAIVKHVVLVIKIVMRPPKLAASIAVRVKFAFGRVTDVAQVRIEFTRRAAKCAERSVSPLSSQTSRNGEQKRVEKLGFESRFGFAISIG